MMQFAKVNSQMELIAKINNTYDYKSVHLTQIISIRTNAYKSYDIQSLN